MKVYKFGGASVCDAAGVRNMTEILKRTEGQLFVVISAMGKVTNALEKVLERFMMNENDQALEQWSQVEQYHRDIIDKLFEQESDRQKVLDALEQFSESARAMICDTRVRDDYDMFYDQIVSFGELFSTRIISKYLELNGVQNTWVDIRKLLITDSCFREAGVRMDQTAVNMQQMLSEIDTRIIVSQGFIGANNKGETTTLGREGSDYTAAIVASSLDAESVTIWKDVPGVLNADPRYFANTVHIPELTYLDAIELAYSGAQIIHPKTIKPLQNKNIPLYVKPFSCFEAAGSVIRDQIACPITVPILILKHKQVLISIRSHDFSFVLEDKFAEIFSVFGKYRQKINLIQSSAVSLTVSVDESRQLERLIDELSADYRVAYNESMELLTVRGYTDTELANYTNSDTVFLTQQTRKVLRIVRKVVKN